MTLSVSAQLRRLRAVEAADRLNPHYKWTALVCVTFATLLATLDSSITLVAMPDIFRGIRLDPLQPSNSFYLLWMILGYLIVTGVLVVTFGRLGDLFGRVRIFNLGFIVYTLASLLLAIDWLHGRAGADWLIGLRLVQGVGAALLLGNGAAILTDAFPLRQRGLALGLNNTIGVCGTFVGLALGGLLAPISWRLVFLISVPTGLAGTIWSATKLRELGVRVNASIDWLGNVTFAAGVVSLMTGVTYGIRPYGSSPMGWSSPFVLGALSIGVLLMAAFVVVESRIEHPMFDLRLFRIRPFTFGTLSTFLSGVARGGLMFILVIWLQGIWLPQHGYSFERTPLYAGIYMLPLIAGMLMFGLGSGFLSDRYGPRPFATAGMIGCAGVFFALLSLPVNFSYPIFALELWVMGAALGMFMSPNRAGVMNSLPPEHRGAGGGMNQTFQNSSQVFSIGIFFTLMVIGLSAKLPSALSHGLQAHGIPAATAQHVGHTPPISVLFAAFLGYNPIDHLVGANVLAHVSAANRATLTGRSFFPRLITGPFRSGLHAAFGCAIGVCLLGALTSLARGERYVAGEADVIPLVDEGEELASIPTVV